MSEDAQGSQLLTQLPVNTLRLWATYRLDGAWNGLTVGGGVDWTSATSLYFSRFDSTLQQDAYKVVNLMARNQFNKKLAATLNINNLFDKTCYRALAAAMATMDRHGMLPWRRDTTFDHGSGRGYRIGPPTYTRARKKRSVNSPDAT